MDDTERLKKILVRIFDDKFWGCGFEDDKFYIDVDMTINSQILNVAVENMLGIYDVDN
jgi:hypothetical protein